MRHSRRGPGRPRAARVPAHRFRPRSGPASASRSGRVRPRSPRLPRLPKEWRFWIADIRYDSFSSVETACGRRLREKAGGGDGAPGSRGSRGRQLSPRRLLSDWGGGAVPVLTYIAAL